ncbi:Peptide methionine sulfoxide reductase MsrB [Candidatus Brocadiaceae bacterium]|jgi:peptide-methionine (R)-S-oxide reductase|nr:methionine-R-sulfoxide reductase [Candidatus Dojkabacteria bacterium]CAG0940176.1 Peptide methionine sulfoxide reductase MsrB [Candidatus Brocadiaceae bacterium]
MKDKFNKLTPQEEDVIVNKATEAPFTGEYDDFYEPGTFVCRRCNLPLFSSEAKFEAHCGWPAFDKSYPNALKKLPDPDGARIEIQCANCGAHLGHEFIGEELTPANVRECVNSLSLKFIQTDEALPEVIK